MSLDCLDWVIHRSMSPGLHVEVTNKNQLHFFLESSSYALFQMACSNIRYGIGVTREVGSVS